jgi:hypothetical protein
MAGDLRSNVLDFGGQLSRIGDSYIAGQERSYVNEERDRERQLREAMKYAVDQQGNIDYQQLARLAVQHSSPQAAKLLSEVGPYAIYPQVRQELGNLGQPTPGAPPPARPPGLPGSGGVSQPASPGALSPEETIPPAQADRVNRPMSYAPQSPPAPPPASVAPPLVWGDGVTGNNPSTLPPPGPAVPGPQGAIPGPTEAFAQAPQQSPAGVPLSPDAVRLLQLLAHPALSAGQREAIKGRLEQVMPQDMQILSLPDGTVLGVNKRTGAKVTLHHGGRTPFQIGEDIYGNKNYGVFDAQGNIVDLSTGRVIQQNAQPGQQPQQPGQQPQAQGAPGGIINAANIDHSLSGDAYLKQFPPEVQSAVKDMIAGRTSPTSNPRRGFVELVQRVARKYGSDIGTPVDDATFAQRRTYRNQLAQGTPASIGGQRNALNTALGHAADAAEYLAALGNVDPFGIPLIARGANIYREATSTEQSGKAQAAREAVDRLAGEVGKLYAGSAGGGVHEREETRNRFRTNMSQPELAGALEAVSHMMGSKLAGLEAQRDEILGPGAADVQIISEKGRAALEKVNATIAKLRGQEPPPAQQQQPTQQPPQQQQPQDQPQQQQRSPPSERAIQILRQRPETRDQFDARYGPGASRAILGQ